MRVDTHVEVAFAALYPRQSVREQDSRPVRSATAERRFADRPDDTEAAMDARPISFVVAETTDERTIEFPERRDCERRDQITGKDDKLDLLLIESFDRQPQIVQVIMNVGKNSDPHFLLRNSYRSEKPTDRNHRRDEDHRAELLLVAGP